MASSSSITLRPCDDMHIHLREGDRLQLTVPHCARQFRRALVMPNTKPPVRTAKDALAYRDAIMKHVPKGLTFDPLMSIYLTDETSPEDIAEAKRSGVVYACKLYPAGATTNSDSGVTDITKIYPTLRAMEKHGLLLLVHGEVTDKNVDIFDREHAFLDRVMKPLVRAFPGLKVVMEHITTARAVEFVLSQGPKVAATVTAHHLMITRSDIFQGGICAHLYCLPVCKTAEDREALIGAVCSGNPKFFAGTDSAPHPRSQKEQYRGYAGVYTGHAAIEVYAETFAKHNCLHLLEDFLCSYGADFYGIPRNRGAVVLERKAWTVPEEYDFPMGGRMEKLVPFKNGEQLSFKLACAQDPSCSNL